MSALGTNDFWCWSTPHTTPTTATKIDARDAHEAAKEYVRRQMSETRSDHYDAHVVDVYCHHISSGVIHGVQVKGSYQLVLDTVSLPSAEEFQRQRAEEKKP